MYKCDACFRYTVMAVHFYFLPFSARVCKLQLVGPTKPFHRTNTFCKWRKTI